MVMPAFGGEHDLIGINMRINVEASLRRSLQLKQAMLLIIIDMPSMLNGR